MKKLFTIFNTDDNGRPISSLGTIYANSEDEARLLSASYFKNPEIYTTGYYIAKLTEASIKMENLEKYHQDKLRQALYDVNKYMSKDIKPEDLKTFVYIQDNQSYYTEGYVFKTNSTLTIEEMEKLSYEPTGAGRHSTSYYTFSKLLNKRGFVIDFLKIIPRDEKVDEKKYKIIKGATGNY